MEIQNKTTRLSFPTSRYVLYAVIGFVIWLSGVVLIRILSDSFFENQSALPLMFGVSLVLGFVIQLISPMLVKQPMRDTMIPIAFICGFALMLDGFAIGFTDIYSANTEVKVSVGAWLLWTFGTQLLITLFMVNRTNE